MHITRRLKTINDTQQDKFLPMLGVVNRGIESLHRVSASCPDGVEVI